MVETPQRLGHNARYFTLTHRRRAVEEIHCSVHSPEQTVGIIRLEDKAVAL